MTDWLTLCGWLCVLAPVLWFATMAAGLYDHATHTRRGLTVLVLCVAVLIGCIALWAAWW